MLPTTEPIETLSNETKHTELRTGGRVWIVIGLLVIAVAVGLLFGLLKPKTYTATAYIQVFNRKPCFTCEEESSCPLDVYIDTQFALMKSPIILEKALLGISNLPVIVRQKDKVQWLAKNLKLQRQGNCNSEILTVSFSAYVPEDAEKIVNSIVNTFFDYDAVSTQDWNNRLLTQLNLELNRQAAAAQSLQRAIRTTMEEAAQQGQSGGSNPRVPEHSEVILRDLYLNELKLDALQAELKMLREPGSIINRLPQNNPMLTILYGRLAELREQVDILKKIGNKEDETKIQMIQSQVDNMEKKIEEVLNASATKTEKTQSAYIQQLEQTIWEKEMAARSQEILVETLRRRYKEIISRTVPIVDISYQQSQLNRINKIREQLIDRISTLETERYAPNRIQFRRKATVPIKPDNWWYSPLFL